MKVIKYVYRKIINQRLEILRDFYKTDIGFKYLPIEEGAVVEIKISYLKDFY